MITQDYLPPGQGVRSGHRLTDCRGLVIHWIGVAQGHASVIRKNYARDELGTQYVIDWYTGEIIQTMPEDEVAYHVGAKRYTDTKRAICGDANPNWYLVGIECCIDPATDIPGDYGAAGKYPDLGRPSVAQYAALVEFAADFLDRHGLTERDLYRHYDITGKVCHVWFVKDAARWEKFKADVGTKLRGESDMTKDEVQAIVDEAVRAAQPKVYTDLDQVPKWAQGAVERAMRTQSKDDPEGVMLIQGDGTGRLHLTDHDLTDLERMRKAGLLAE